MDLARSTSAARLRRDPRPLLVEDERSIEARHVRRRRRPSRHGPRLFVRSPLARRGIVEHRHFGALELPGVAAVFVASDLNPDVREPWYSTMGKDVPDTPRPPMAEGEVRFVGDLRLLVIAGEPLRRGGCRLSSSTSSTNRCHLWSTISKRCSRRSSSTSHMPDRRRRLNGAKPGRSKRHAGRRVRCLGLRRSTSRHMSPFRWRRTVSIVEWSSGELTMWAANRRRTKYACSASRFARPARASHPRDIMRDTGGGFGQKTVAENTGGDVSHARGTGRCRRR